MSTFFHTKRQSFYYRCIIPRRLRPYFGGRVQYWRSLRTEDRDQARARSAQWEARVQRVFVTLIQRGKGMTKAEIESLIDHWMERELDESEDFRATCGRVNDDFRESMYYVLSDQFDEADEALVSCDYRKVAQEADDLLKSASLPLLDHKSTAFGRLCRRLLIAKQGLTRIEADRWEGIYKDVPKGNGNGSSIKGQSVSLHEHRRPIAEVIRLYFQENRRAERTDGQVKAELERFLQLIGGGERPIGTINKTDTRAYKENMLQARNLSLVTCIKHLSNLSVLFKWAEAQGFIAENSNPVRGPCSKQTSSQETVCTTQTIHR